MIAALVLAGAFVFPPIVTAERPPVPTPDLEHAHAQRAENVRRRDYEQLEREQARTREARTRAATSFSTPHGVGEPRSSDDVAAFLACTRGHESDTAGGYRATDAAHPGAEENSGAYGFSQSTWNATARHAGALELVGVKPMDAAPADQDRLAAELYRWQGKTPWGGRC